MSSFEAVWRILCFDIHYRYPAITHLHDHLENGQRIYFTDNNGKERIADPPTTTLLEFLK